jgi:hypothetical protein
LVLKSEQARRRRTFECGGKPGRFPITIVIVISLGKSVDVYFLADLRLVEAIRKAMMMGQRAL